MPERTSVRAGWEQPYTGGVAHYFPPGERISRCTTGGRTGSPAPRDARTCKRCTTLLAADLVGCAFAPQQTKARP